MSFIQKSSAPSPSLDRGSPFCSPPAEGWFQQPHRGKLRRKEKWTHLAATLKPVTHDSANATMLTAERVAACLSYLTRLKPDFRIQTRGATMYRWMIKLTPVSGPTKCWLPQWPGSHHKLRRKLACTYRKHLSRKPNIHQSQTNESASGRSPNPRKQDPLALQGIP